MIAILEGAQHSDLRERLLRDADELEALAARCEEARDQMPI